jgi:transcriptional regulator
LILKIGYDTIKENGLRGNGMDKLDEIRQEIARILWTAEGNINYYENIEKGDAGLNFWKGKREGLQVALNVIDEIKERG